MASKKQLTGMQVKQRAVMLAQENRLGEAKSLCENLCRKNGKDSEAWFLLGTIHGHMQNFPEAIKCFQRAVKLSPRTVAGHYNLGIALHRTHDYSGAAASFREAIRLQPGLVEAHLSLAHLLTEQGQQSDAEQHFREVLRYKPDHIETLGSLGNLHQKAGAYEEAASCYQKALAIRPDIAELHFSLGNAFRSMGKPEDALASYNRALELNPRLAVALNNKGLIYLESARPDDAITLFQKSLEIDPSQAEARINLSTALRDKGEFAAAMEPLHSLLNDQPEHPQAHGDLSLLLLQTGDFSRGWKEYEWRLKGKTAFARQFPQPGWQGENLDNKTILVHAEQGVGDEIMFASCIPDIIERSSHVVINCDERLAPLFQRSFPSVTVHGADKTSDTSWLSNIPEIDYQVPAGSLPLYLRPDLDHFPAHNGYLSPDPERMAFWRRRYDDLGQGMKVGISWKGGHVSRARLRSTELSQWREILSLEGLHFINLQYGQCESELSSIRQLSGIRIHHWKDSDPLVNLDDFAAQISALDLVISVDNSTVHMAGALGIPVWVLQPYVADWRWLPYRDDSYWYPSMRQFRQEKPGSWAEVFKNIMEAIISMTEGI